MKGNTIKNCVLIDLKKNHQEKGNITVIQNKKDIPFNVQRIYYLYDIPGGESRGGHAHKQLYQLMVAASGSFDVILNDGKETKKISLNRPFQAISIVPGIWRELINFSSGAICLVLASANYDENDYIRDFDIFTKYKK